MSELFSEKIITEIIEFILKYCQKNDNANNINLMISLSGGVDSVTLLYSLYLIKKYNLLDGKNINLSAIYIHHGISKNADSWLAFCENICHEFSIKFFGKRIQLNQNNIKQKGLEDAARNARYKAIIDICKKEKIHYLFAAQHANDQIETIFMRLLRGSGLKGLKAMDNLRLINFENNIYLCRPLLKIYKKEIVNFAKKYNLQWITDESNFDTENYTRNYIRHNIITPLENRFGKGSLNSILKITNNAAEALQLLDEFAAEDFAKVALSNNSLSWKLSMQLFNEARLKNLLTWKIKTLFNDSVLMPTANKFNEFIRQLKSSVDNKNAMPKITFGNVKLIAKSGGSYIERNQKK